MNAHFPLNVDALRTIYKSLENSSAYLEIFYFRAYRRDNPRREASREHRSTTPVASV